MIIKEADRLNQVQEYYFSKKPEQLQKMRSQGIDVINLGIGSPDLAPPPVALIAATETVQKPSSHGYAPYRSTPELRQAMAKWYQETYRVRLSATSEILPLLGSKEGILYLSMAFLNQGDAVLVPNPGYPAYASVANLLGARVIYYALTEESGWLPDLEKLGKQDLSSCKIMWVNYPHMPTGQVCPPDFFKQLVEFGKKHKILICNDNPYSLVLNQGSPSSILAADPDFEVTAELNSLSKSFNMAGWRVGMFLSRSDVVDAVLKVKSNVDSGMFLGIQNGAIAALGVEDAWHEKRNNVYRKRRDQIWKIFDLLDFKYSANQVGLFVWAKVPDSIPDVVAYLDRILDEAHVFLTPGMIFGSNGSRYVRSSLCSPEQTLEEAVRRIEGFKK